MGKERRRLGANPSAARKLFCHSRWRKKIVPKRRHNSTVEMRSGRGRRGRGHWWCWWWSRRWWRCWRRRRCGWQCRREESGKKRSLSKMLCFLSLSLPPSIRTLILIAAAALTCWTILTLLTLLRPTPSRPMLGGATLILRFLLCSALCLFLARLARRLCFSWFW